MLSIIVSAKYILQPVGDSQQHGAIDDEKATFQQELSAVVVKLADATEQVQLLQRECDESKSQLSTRSEDILRLQRELSAAQVYLTT